MQSTPQDTNRGYLAALGSALLLSLTSIFIRYLSLNYQMPALVLAFWREIFVALILLPVFACFNRHLLRNVRPHLPYLLGYGLVLALFNAFWTISVILNGAAVGTVLAYCSAAFTALLGWLILHEELTFAKILAVAVSLTGCALIVDAFNPAVWQVNAPGILTGIAAGLFYAFYSLLGRSAAQRGINPWSTLFFTFLFAAGCMLCINLLLGRHIPGGARSPAEFFWLGNSLPGWVILFLLALGPTLLGYGLYNVSLKHLPSSVANMIVTIEPVFTSIVAYFMFAELLTSPQIIGSLMIMLGVFILRWFRKRVG